MISELKMSDFNRCKDLINEDGHMEVKAVMEGNNPGRIFVDNTESPDAALMWLGNNDGFFYWAMRKTWCFGSNWTISLRKLFSQKQKCKA